LRGVLRGVLGVGKFESASSRTVAQFRRGRDLPKHEFVGDPALRLKNGSARDDEESTKIQD